MSLFACTQNEAFHFSSISEMHREAMQMPQQQCEGLRSELPWLAMPGDASSPQAESFLVSPPGHHCLALAFLLLPFLCCPSGLFILHSDCPILLVGKLEAVATLGGSCCL